MADDEKKVDLSKVEPLRPPPDADAPGSPDLDAVDRVGAATALETGARPAFGVSSETIDERRTREDEELDNLRR
jgi:hypothetical protein